MWEENDIRKAFKCGYVGKSWLKPNALRLGCYEAWPCSVRDLSIKRIREYL